MVAFLGSEEIVKHENTGIFVKDFHAREVGTLRSELVRSPACEVEKIKHALNYSEKEVIDWGQPSGPLDG